MLLEIRGENLEVSEWLRDHIERRVQFELARFSARISRVTICLADVNGSRSGVDKHCRIMVRLPQLGRIVVEDTDDDLAVVADRAVHRVGQAVRRELERRRGADMGR